jgi:hypothetical protein
MELVMKQLYKSTKVIFDAHQKQYEVYYKNWFVWHFDSCYKYDERDSNGYLINARHHCDKLEAEKRAIERAQAMLNTVEVWKQSQVFYY